MTLSAKRVLITGGGSVRAPTLRAALPKRGRRW